MSETVTAAPAKPASTAASAIAFRPENSRAGMDAGGVLLILAALLAAAVALLWFARRKGWLERWIGPVAPARAEGRMLRIERSLRVSPRTVVHRIIDGASAYLVVESTANVCVREIAADAEAIDD